MTQRVSFVASAGFAIVLGFCGGCRSPHLDMTVENHTGAAIRLLEVDYPSASFGSDAMAAGGSMQYRVHVQGDGPVKVQYTAADGRQVSVSGPSLTNRQEGKLDVDLLPGGKAAFHP